MQGNLANDLLNGGPGDDFMDGDNEPFPNPPLPDPPGDADRCHGASGADDAVRCERTTGVP
jgi:hypothetical protein